MTLDQLTSELALYVQDDSLEPHFKSWINLAVLEIANDFSLPALKTKEPVDLVCTNDVWLYDMPSSFQKNLYKAYDSDYNKITVKRDLGDIDNLDIEHTDTGDNITHVAVRDTQIGVYPMATETIKLWFYKKPTDLVEDSDELTCIPKQYHSRVVVSKVICKAYPLLMDMAVNPPERSLIWWRNNYSEGLFGSPGGDIGMLNVMARNRRPKRRGGADPLP